MKRRTNADLLVERLTTSFIDRTKPEREKKLLTSHMQGMAQFFGEELLALAAGAGECTLHHGLVDGACPRCRGFWPADETCGAATPGQAKRDTS